MSFPSLSAILVIVITTLIGVFGYWIAPDNSPSANRQIPDLALLPPFSSVDVLCVPQQGVEKTSFWKGSLSGFNHGMTYTPVKSVLQQGDKLEIEAIRNGGAIFKKVLDLPAGSYEVKKIHFLLGTDGLGRCVLSRLILGARVTMSVGLVAVLVSLLIGVLLGALAGYYGGKVDAAIMYVANVLWSVPTLLLIFALVLAFGRGMNVIFLSIGLTLWVEVARLVRGQVLMLKNLQYVEAAQVLGFSDFRTLVRHILPNVVGTIMVIATANFAGAIMIEAGLSYLGFGIAPPSPSWGGMLNESRGYLVSGKAYLSLIPAAAIMILVLSFNLLSNFLRDIADVR